MMRFKSNHHKIGRLSLMHQQTVNQSVGHRYEKSAPALKSRDIFGLKSFSQNNSQKFHANLPVQGEKESQCVSEQPHFLSQHTLVQSFQTLGIRRVDLSGKLEQPSVHIFPKPSLNMFYGPSIIINEAHFSSPKHFSLDNKLYSYPILVKATNRKFY